MSATRVTAKEFRQSFDALSERATREPIVITDEGVDALVILSANEWERLRRHDRRVGETSDLPDGWLEAVAGAEVSDTFKHLDDELK